VGLGAAARQRARTDYTWPVAVEQVVNAYGVATRRRVTV
jgi:hypothetical protein